MSVRTALVQQQQQIEKIHGDSWLATNAPRTNNAVTAAFDECDSSAQRIMTGFCHEAMERLYAIHCSSAGVGVHTSRCWTCNAMTPAQPCCTALLSCLIWTNEIFWLLFNLLVTVSTYQYIPKYFSLFQSYNLCTDAYCFFLFLSVQSYKLVYMPVLLSSEPSFS